MAYTTINKSTEHFNTKLYTGNSSTQSITGVGFQPDWTWIKSRNYDNAHHVFDAVRGVQKRLLTSGTQAEATMTDGLSAFGADGFTLGSNGAVNGAYNYASWNWKANGAGSANTDGDINSTVSVNQTAGFSIVKYTGNGSTNQTVGHGLGTTPKFKIIKSLGATAEGWVLTGSLLGSTIGNRIFMNTNAAMGNPSGYYALDTSTTIGISNSNSPSSQNANGEGFIAYCFVEKKGFSKFGSYKGNGSTDGSFIYTGFKPAFVILKIAEHAGSWLMFDNKRDSLNPNSHRVYANGSDVEDTGSGSQVDFLSNGFKCRSSDQSTNTVNNKYFYMAFGQALVGSNNVPCTAM